MFGETGTRYESIYFAESARNLRFVYSCPFQLLSGDLESRSVGYAGDMGESQHSLGGVPGGGVETLVPGVACPPITPPVQGQAPPGRAWRGRPGANQCLCSAHASQVLASTAIPDPFGGLIGYKLEAYSISPSIGSRWMLWLTAFIRHGFHRGEQRKESLIASQLGNVETRTSITPSQATLGWWNPSV